MSRRILIVDDDPTICRELQKELKRNFFPTYVAGNSKDAFEILNKNKIDIILLDIFMPDIDGLDMLEKVKSKWPSIEVIIITGYSSQDVAIKALRRGAIDYLEKPINYEELTTSIGRAMEKITEKADLTYRHTILLVDDDKSATKRLSRILTKEGYEVFTANDGREGLRIINNNKIDILIADIEMPIMGGIELLEKVKKFQKDIEVIVMTGFGDESLAIEALRKGAINYLRKPIDLDEVLIAIEQAVERIILYRNQLYRDRELKINSQIVSKINEELERRIEERTLEITQVQSQLFQTAKLATLGEMAAGLAHELNQPLAGMSLCTTNMKKLKQRDLLTDSEIDETIENIEGLIKRMSKIIVHIRTFARQDLQKFKPTDINESAENALNLMEEQLRLNNIEIKRNFGFGIPQINGEPYQIEQIVINALSNAKDALNQKESSGAVDITGWRKCIEIKTSLVNEWASIDIIDNGMGMSKEVKEKIFEPFYTTKEVGKATGLGLSISYGIIESHKGRIDVSTEEGKGTTMSIRLPIITREEGYEE
ncbi:response regulator [uncultured Ilyobacter sp.]|uniref:hybrid sensor histidine kinase/response regulator n=1 Tax=uncultured Ilyobacter sp. TaxID=544433 RepID=UPI0029C8881E|nr:response regulator [uncultured Ilyobacter sp.]